MPRRSAALVELVDLAPTMAALAGIPMPEGEVFDGVSLVRKALSHRTFDNSRRLH